jgi:hypothetical protein
LGGLKELCVESIDSLNHGRLSSVEAKCAAVPAQKVVTKLFPGCKKFAKNMLQSRRNNMYYLALFSGSLCGPLLET